MVSKPSKISELYQAKENRDLRAKQLKLAGYKVMRNSYRNQQIHPQYIKDYLGPEKYQTELGNTVYKTTFTKLYEVTAHDE